MTTPTNQLTEITETKKLCDTLYQSPHYQKIGLDGIWAIVTTARSLGIEPMQALNGGLYYVKGKVEMSSRMMTAMIRSKGHSITRDGKSSDEACILHGKRKDSGDCWTESFSMEEAKRAGLVRAGSPWATFPRDMLYARALSRLARQLFADLILSVFVEGEISLDPNINPEIIKLPIAEPTISKEETIELGTYLIKMPEERQRDFLNWMGVTSITEIKSSRFSAAKDALEKATK